MSNDINYSYQLALANFNSFSNKNKQQILTHFNSIKNFFELSQKELFEFCSKYTSIQSKKNITLFFESKAKLLDKANQTKEECIKKSIQPVFFNDIYYPLTLKYIYDPPYVLFIQGNWERYKNEFQDISKKNFLAIVGTRKSSSFIEDKTLNLARESARIGITVISGLAIGVDGMAHQGVIDTKSGLTIAVLGSGFNHIYPKKHQNLANNILEQGGLLISEYHLDSLPISYHFPIRNRIITGLSNALVMMQAGEKSGALISVNYALEQGKEIFVYQPQHDKQIDFEGNWKTINDGARGFNEYHCIFEFFSRISLQNKNINPQIEFLYKRSFHLSEIAKKINRSEMDTLNWLTPFLIKGEVVETVGNQYYAPTDLKSKND